MKSNFIKNLFKHLRLVRIHRRNVRRMCFKMGIPIRGLLHDLSKYSWKELSICKYYDGTRSPHEVARRELGSSPSWMYHKAKNKHHWEFWTDNNSDAKFYAVKMPYKYMLESFCDMVGASKAYKGENYTDSSPLQYFEGQMFKRLYHERTRKTLLLLFKKLSDLGEKEFINWYKQNKTVIKNYYNQKENTNG